MRHEGVGRKGSALPNGIRAPFTEGSSELQIQLCWWSQTRGNMCQKMWQLQRYWGRSVSDIVGEKHEAGQREVRWNLSRRWRKFTLCLEASRMLDWFTSKPLQWLNKQTINHIWFHLGNKEGLWGGVATTELRHDFKGSQDVRRLGRSDLSWSLPEEGWGQSQRCCYCYLKSYSPGKVGDSIR